MRGFLFFLVAFAAGCAGTGPGGAERTSPVADPGLIITPDRRVTGKVVSASQNYGFVVIAFPLGAVPAVGTHLDVYRQGLKVGEVKVTGPQRDINTVADIVAGEAGARDEVREK